MDPSAPGDRQDSNFTEKTELIPGSPYVNAPEVDSESATVNQTELDPQISETPKIPPQESPIAYENTNQIAEGPYNQTPTEPSSPEQITQQTPENPALPAEPTPGQNIHTDLPQVFTSQAPSPHEAVTDNSTKRSRKPLIFLLIVLSFILILSGLGGFAYAVAYEKIKLDKYPDLQKEVSYFVMQVPFMPKTPKFLLAKTALAHQDITKQSFDISVAVDSADLSSSLGLSNLDIQAKGDFDYSNPKNIFGNLEISFTKDFNMEFKKKEKMLYFKLNKIPSFLFAFLGIGSETFDPLLEKWVSYDTTPLDTEARKTISKDKEVDPLSEEFVDENFDKFIDDKVLSKMQLGSDIEEGHPVHRITLDADSELIDYIGKKIEDESRQRNNYVYPQTNSDNSDKLSDFVKKLKWEMYIDKETYYTRKAIFSFDLEYDSSDSFGAFSLGSLTNPLPSNNTAKIVLAAKFDKFGEEVIVETPADSITFEEFTKLLSSSFNNVYSTALISPESQLAQARDAKRKSDLMTLRSALELYRSDCSRYPSTLSNMTHTAGSENCQYQSGGGIYIMTIPTDTDGTNYFYQVTENGNSYSLCANLEIPETATSTCPDSSYNYHINNESYSYLNP